MASSLFCCRARVPVVAPVQKPALISALVLSLALSLALSLGACGRPQNAPTTPPSEAAGTVWLNEGVVLYMPDQVMKTRIRIEDLSPYMKKVETAARAVVEAQEGQNGTSGMLLVGLRPDGQSKAWVVTGEPPMAKPVADAMIAAVEAVPAPPVTEQTVLLGIQFHAFGGGTAPVSSGPPIPREWYAHFSRHGGLLDDALMDKVWPRHVAEKVAP